MFERLEFKKNTSEEFVEQETWVNLPKQKCSHGPPNYPHQNYIYIYIHTHLKLHKLQNNLGTSA